MKFIIQYKNQYIKIKANENYFHICKSYRFTSIKNMKNIINKIKEYIYMYKIDDFVVKQYYINCATENGIIGYPIQYCPICGKNLNKS